MRGTKNEAGGTVIGELSSGIQVAWYEGTNRETFEEACERFDARQEARASKKAARKPIKLSKLPAWLTYEIADRATCGEYELEVTATTISGPRSAIEEIPQMLLESIDLLSGDHNSDNEALREGTLRTQEKARRRWAAKIARRLGR